MNKYCPKCMNLLKENDYLCPFCSAGLPPEVPPHHLLPGTLLKNRYYVGAALGEGGFGITYIGKDTILGITVAIKEYYPCSLVNRSNTDSPVIYTSCTQERKEFFKKGKQSFLKEAQALAKFDNCPGIVSVKDYFEENNTAYIIMEYLDGITLREFFKTNGVLSYEQAISVMKPIIESLSKIHAAGLIHRDISPENIMLSGKTVKLIDFGAARFFSGEDEHSLSVVLKHGYAPEEQYRTKGHQGPWTDVYALCATIYECITGVTPDQANDRLRNDELKAPSELGVNISPGAEFVLMKGLNLLQEQRYQNVSHFLYDLETDHNASDVKTVFIPAEDSHVKETDIPSDTDKKSKKRNVITALLITVAVLLIIGVMAFVSVKNNQNPESEDPSPSPKTSTQDTSAEPLEETEQDPSDTDESQTESPEWRVKPPSGLSQEDARISGSVSFSSEVYCTEIGFYLGTSSANLRKNAYPDKVNINSASVNLSFLMSDCNQTLSPGTTYYYKMYVIADDNIYTSSVNSFRTAEKITDATEDNTSAVVTPPTNETPSPQPVTPNRPEPPSQPVQSEDPPSSPSAGQEHRLELSYAVAGSSGFSDQNCVITAITSDNVTRISLFDEVNGNYYDGMNMRQVDDTTWIFSANIYETGRHKITAKAYYSDGTTKTDVIYLNYPFN